MQLREQLDTIIYSLLEKIPRGKKALPPQKSIKIEEGCNLIPKPPLSNSIKSIPTKIEIIHGHNVEIGNLPNDKKVMIHGFSGSKLLFLEALMLTDADMNLCTGYKGGIGFKYSYELNLIVSPKSIKDLLIQSFEDASSDFGPVRNLYNLQHRYLQANGVENNYIPKLICEKLNIDMSEYNRRINALINNDIHYLEDIESIDKELFDAVTDITSNERLFEGIMRPNIEGIMIPAGFAISENLASFAERYDIKIFYGNI